MSKIIPLALAVCLWLANGLANQPLEAHPISLSSTIVNIKADQIDVEMDIMLEDLVLYHRLAADGDTRFSPKDLKAAAQKHRQFILDYFSILNADGERLVGEIVTESSETINTAGVLQSELMRHSVRYQIVYPLKTPKPTFVTFLQNFGGDKAVLPAVMDLFLLQDGAFVERPTQITYGRPHIMKLNWTKPEAAGRISMADLRKQREEQLRERLGIASYTGLFSFLYVTRFEVRHEVLIPLLTLEQWLPIPRKDKNYLEVEEQAAAREAIEKFFREKNTVTINGEVVDARLTRLNFFSLDINDFALNAEPRRVNVAQAR
ncbi:MAG: hypothetical protein IT423_03560, partial [Pirellulaceae bacterium]|nr:hypothetical protein [Pirellulaceae bacterium]